MLTEVLPVTDPANPCVLTAVLTSARSLWVAVGRCGLLCIAGCPAAVTIV